MKCAIETCALEAVQASFLPASEGLCELHEARWVKSGEALRDTGILAQPIDEDPFAQVRSRVALVDFIRRTSAEERNAR